MPAWERIDLSRPAPKVSPAWIGTVTRPPLSGCFSWTCEPFWTTTTHPLLKGPDDFATCDPGERRHGAKVLHLGYM